MSFLIDKAADLATLIGFLWIFLTEPRREWVKSFWGKHITKTRICLALLLLVIVVPLGKSIIFGYNFLFAILCFLIARYVFAKEFSAIMRDLAQRFSQYAEDLYSQKHPEQELEVIDEKKREPAQ